MIPGKAAGVLRRAYAAGGAPGGGAAGGGGRAELRPGEAAGTILATGLGEGLAIDAIVIRCLLVPAMVALFGRFNWWLPAPLARVLRVTDGPVRPARPAAPAGEAAREPAAVLLNSR